MDLLTEVIGDLRQVRRTGDVCVGYAKLDRAYIDMRERGLTPAGDDARYARQIIRQIIHHDDVAWPRNRGRFVQDQSACRVALLQGKKLQRHVKQVSVRVDR